MGSTGIPAWRQAWAAPTFRTAFLGAVVAGTALVAVLPRFFAWIGARPGGRLHDPLLDRFGPMDVSGLTFGVLYAVLAVAIISAARHPWRLLQGLYAYLLMVLLRMAAMASFTLEPPDGIIPLVDPVTQLFYPGAAPFLKDLFFSGHTATLVLMALLVPPGRVRWLAALGAATVALLVLAQHVHWTVDVVAAVPAAWAAWWAAGALLARWGLTASAEAA